MLWCILLVLFNKYKIGSKFLHKCKIYFSRKACLHYVGNSLGAKLRSRFSAFSITTFAITVLVSLAVNNVPV